MLKQPKQENDLEAKYQAIAITMVLLLAGLIIFLVLFL